ncbi:LacI family DNA-binding transcriptional regulator [Actinophytocola sp.]|uniref:LacI family DNA-binding transcriptional regulator n=1 Tax=Actinophytocola sp. TaxID=1872138 RepID=UPI002ED04FBE
MNELPPAAAAVPDVAAARPPTMREVAAKAGVSLKTVSRVVNNESGVSPALAERVREAIEELDFRPNAGARSLRRADQRSASIALLLEDVANPFSAAVQRAVENIAVPRGVMVFSASLDEDPTRERALAREFSVRRTDGLIIAPAGDDQSYLATELRAGTPVVCVDREVRNLAADSVVATNALGAAEGVRHLVAAGHRRIAFLGDSSRIVTAQQRYAGYRHALDEAGIPIDPDIVRYQVGDSAAADSAVTSMLSRPDPPTALFTAQNLITIGAVRALRRLGREHTTALVGFDDFQLADLLTPGITVVAQDPTAIGRFAADLLFARLDGTATAPSVYLVPTTLIRRGSGEIPPPEPDGHAPGRTVRPTFL